VSIIVDAAVPGPQLPQERARKVKSGSTGVDRVFQVSLRAAGLTVLLIMGTISVFLFVQGFPALTDAGWKFLTTQAWEPDTHNFGVATLITGTLLIAAVAVIFAVPLATGVALYISEYAPRRLRRALINTVDLMAAVPAVVYGLWVSISFKKKSFHCPDFSPRISGGYRCCASARPTQTTPWSH
jgi:phosphate transport system permease protein